MRNRDAVSLLVELKKNIEVFEDILNKTKEALYKTKATGSKDELKNVLIRFRRITKRLRKIGEGLYSQWGDIDEGLKEHITTLTQYIVLVSIPYEIDLLKDVEPFIKDEDMKPLIEEAIRLANETRTMLAKLS